MYCTSPNKEDFKPDCEEKSLNLIDFFSIKEDDVEVFIYKCEKCNRLYKCISFQGEKRYIKMGEMSIKRDEYASFMTKFPIVYFEKREAYYYDNSLFCGNPTETKGYKQLTCSFKTLEIVKNIFVDDFLKEQIYRCKKCNTFWFLREEYDSHHGYVHQAKIHKEIGVLCVKVPKSEIEDVIPDIFYEEEKGLFFEEITSSSMEKSLGVGYHNDWLIMTNVEGKFIFDDKYAQMLSKKYKVKTFLISEQMIYRDYNFGWLKKGGIKKEYKGSEGGEKYLKENNIKPVDEWGETMIYQIIEKEIFGKVTEKYGSTLNDIKYSKYVLD